MKKLFTLIMLCSAGFLFGQTTGKIIDAENNVPLVGATVVVDGTEVGTITDIDGTFSLNASEGDKLVISYLGYDTKMIEITTMGDLGTIGVSAGSILEEIVVTGVVDLATDRKTPVAVSTIGLKEIQAKGVGNVEFPEVMKNTPSVYVSNQTGFGDSQMFTRGFGQTNTAFLLNGQPINGMEDGRMYWSNWSGMSDVASAVQIQRGLGSSKLAISSVGGTTNIVTRTIENDKGGFVRLMTGNDGYLKGTVAYNTGLNNKWAFSLLLDHWQGQNKWADGTKGQGQNYFLSLGYKPTEKSTFNFLVTGAPQWHGQRWSQSLETLQGDPDNDIEARPKFNQHWGEFDGEWESERRNFYHKPVINLSWDYDINENSQLSSVVYASFGRGGGTGPFGDSDNRVRTAAGQVDFDAIYDNNILDDDGLGSFSDNYAIRASMNNHQWYGNVTKYEMDITENLNWSIGADMRWYKGDHFRQFANLLGLDGWQDNFRHATRSGDAIQSAEFSPTPWNALFNFADEDERIAYDYSEQINYQGGFTQLEYSLNGFSVFAQGALSNQSYQREGRWADQGESDKINKIGYNIKGGASYSINNNNIVFGNAGFYSRQPFLDNIFTNIRYSNELIENSDGQGVENEEILGLELGYKYQKNDLKVDVNAYSTAWNNRTTVSVFDNDNGTEDDDTDDFEQRTIQRGVSQLHNGVELDVHYNLNSIGLNAYVSVGDWTYNGIESAQSFNNDTGDELSSVGDINNEGVHVFNAPQTSIGLGIDYDATSSLSFYTDFNFYDRLFQNNINFNEDFFIFTDNQGTLDSYFLIDLGASYNFNIGDEILTLRGNVYNLLNNDYINQTDVFGYLNGNGLTWNVSLKYSFN